jgi:hypothetical protein
MRFLSMKDKLFLVLFLIGFSSIVYSTYKLSDDKFGMSSSFVKQLKFIFSATS